ncbi:MAG TPA: type II toxin-antitoxin system RelE/ParE family toxin [Firmicutes bacterium]|jgi:toxin ParE1/3/4|nr:type II toxin-antitoxin system RelE/ParE family toxin [Bacillota bacterium]
MLKSNYRLKLTSRASKDLDKIYNYIANELYAKEAANNLLEKIEASIMRLRDH